MNHDAEQRLLRLADRVEIHDALLRYCRGVDRFDRELVASAFHPDAVDNHGLFKGEGRAIPDVVLEANGVGSLRSMHCVLNHLIEVDGDRAWSEAYFVRWKWNLADDGQPVVDTRNGRYIDEFERRNGEWKISRRVVISEWTDISPISPNGTDDKYLSGLRTREDVSYAGGTHPRRAK